DLAAPRGQPASRSGCRYGATMNFPDFVTGLELALRLRAVPFDRAELETWAADVWRLAEDEPDVIRWAEAFLAARQDPLIRSPLPGAGLFSLTEPPGRVTIPSALGRGSPTRQATSAATLAPLAPTATTRCFLIVALLSFVEEFAGLLIRAREFLD